MVGGGSLLTGIFEAAKKEFDATVSLGDPFSNVQVPAFIQDVLADVGPTFATAIGLALRALKQ